MDKINWNDPAQWPWWLRYLTGVALIVGAFCGLYFAFQPHQRTSNTLAILGGVLFAVLLALGLMRELAIVGVICLILAGLGYLVAGLPTSIAIIIGAIIIAGAVSSRRT